jgi:uncharacterized repeat protein (TIGR01451 family)
VEALEPRALLAGTVTSGIYIENFHQKANPAQPGFHVGEAFTEEFDYIGEDSKGIFRSIDETIVDPTQTMGTLKDGWTLQADPNDSSKDQLELEHGCEYIVKFPNLQNDVHVAAVSLDVQSANALVQISGTTDGSVTNVQGQGMQHIFLGEQHIGPSGREVGAIREILVFARLQSGFLSFPDVQIENVTALVVPNGTNQPPVAGDALATVAPGQSVTIDVLANDFDPNGAQLHLLSIQSPPSHGTAQIANGLVTYTADAMFHGTDSFLYEIEDTRGLTATGKVTVTVNAPPTAPNQDFTVPHGTTGSFSVAAPGLLTKATDSDGDALTLSVTDGAHGHVTLDGTTGGFTYTPIGNGLVNYDQFTYTVSDGLTSATGTVYLNPVNQLPPAAADVTETVAHGTLGPLTFPAPGLFAVNPRTDADGDTLRPVLVTGTPYPQAAYGRVILNSDGSFTYIPNNPAQPDRADSFTYALSNGYRPGPTATVRFQVPNHPPVATPLDLSFDSAELLGKPVSLGNVKDFATDADGDPISFLSASVTGGTVTSDAQGNLTFTPAPGQTYIPDAYNRRVVISFSVTVTDGYAPSNPATVTLTYAVIPPVAKNLTMVMEGVGSIHDQYDVEHLVLQDLNGYGFNPPFHDANGNPVHAIAVNGPLHGTMNFQDGDVFYRALRPYRTDTFSYRLVVGPLESNVATVTLVPHRAPPELFPSAITIDLDNPRAGITRDILSNDFFPDGTPVEGRAVPILLGDDFPNLEYNVNGVLVPLNIGDKIDFRSGNLVLAPPNPGQLTGRFKYTVLYNLNDDPNPPTRQADQPNNIVTAEAEVTLLFVHGVPHPAPPDNVAAAPDSTDGGKVTLTSAPGTQLIEVQFSDPSKVPHPPPPGLTFPLGVLSFRLLGPFPQDPSTGLFDGPTTVDLMSPIALPAPPDFHYYKYGPVPGTIIGSPDGWYDFLYDGVAGAEWINPHLVRLHLVEFNILAGEIDDPGGVAIATPAVLALSQSLAPAAPTVGNDLTFTLTVTNRAPVPAPGVVLTDPLPVGVTFVSAMSSQGSSAVNGGTVQCSLGTLAPGASATVSVVVRPTAPGSLTNTARVTGALLDPAPSNDVATATATVVPAGSLEQFVTTLYLEILVRSPEPEGLDFWVKQLEAGVPPQRAARAIFDSPEHRERVRQHLDSGITFDRAFLDALGAERSAETRLPTAKEDTSHGHPPSLTAIRLAPADIVERFLRSDG